MIDRLLRDDLTKVTAHLVDDLRRRTDEVEKVRDHVRGLYSRAQAPGRTDRSYEEWREDLLDQVAVGWILATVFVRFCEDNRLYATPLLSGPGERRHLARDHRADWLARYPAAGDREWLEEVFRRYRNVAVTAELFGDRNPLWQFGPSADGARRLLELWWQVGDDNGGLRHDFTDRQLDTRFLGDLYQDLSEHAKKTYALLQTPEFVEEFILDHTLDPAIATFGLDQVRMIDPSCGSGRFLLGAFHRMIPRWREREPGTSVRQLVQQTLDAVNGVDLNPYAVAIARFRLLVAALRASGVTELADAPAFRINVAVGDSLIHGRRAGRLFADMEGFGPLLRHRYPTEDEELANRLLKSGQYHAVVGNPPYITVKDPALRDAYRVLYESAYRQYSLGVPFTERFFDLAATPDEADQAGYVGMITTNTFMKRELGKKLVEDYLPTVDLTHIVDTSGAHIPGHGTPTVILFGRHQRPTSETVRVVLGIRGEPGRPSDPAKGKVWTAIIEHGDKPGAENEYVSVEDAPRGRYATHPWSLQGGEAPRLRGDIEEAATRRLEDQIRLVGYTGQTNADPVFLGPEDALRRRGVEQNVRRRLVVGEAIRDWAFAEGDFVVFPYHLEAEQLIEIRQRPGLFRAMWPWRTVLGSRRTFSKQSYFEENRPWWEWHQVALDRVPGFSIMFAEIATHNHFVLDRGGKVFNRTAPIIKLPEGSSEDQHLGQLGLLNSSTSEFWVKQVCHDKGVGGIGGGIGDEAWEPRYVRDGSKIRQFPLPDGAPLERARELDQLASRLAESLPAAVLDREAPSRAVLGEARERVGRLRSRMVALQEELDWECYRLYGLVDEELTLPSDEVQDLNKGERAFEIVLARQIAAGEATSTWFERHDSTSITELPQHWPDDYRALVERRIELITSDRAIGLLERPEYKRRWNWEAWGDLEREALRRWLLDRLEANELWSYPGLSTCARLADRVRIDEAFGEAARLYTGRIDLELTALVTDLVTSEAVPFAAGWRYQPSGLRKRREWERVWDLQRVQDAIDARTKLPPDHPNHLDQEDAELKKKQQGLDKIPVPPKYRPGDFAKSTYWRLRGKLDVPKERFILYPDTHMGADPHRWSAGLGGTTWRRPGRWPAISPPGKTKVPRAESWPVCLPGWWSSCRGWCSGTTTSTLSLASGWGTSSPASSRPRRAASG